MAILIYKLFLPAYVCTVVIYPTVTELINPRLVCKYVAVAPLSVQATLNGGRGNPIPSEPINMSQAVPSGTSGGEVPEGTA